MSSPTNDQLAWRIDQLSKTVDYLERLVDNLRIQMEAQMEALSSDIYQLDLKVDRI